ncbi:bifunctional aspartate kinase/homoserine dehydrogenase I [Gemmatimonas sp.]|uniref:bifunctional aspartate kinase/homoserine dehydrogenase I n=1 Tax=Gemmatimonas sp. TaxID=1962908 RepID=UPI0022C4FECF|nr:bifunctional aspartate kinase/homoserine dehydrogenase I [Gemmatimonas sp.]MCZ8010477.1 bifunctional aspartate kinase/homoserine dehydrogenase I [Gemmatimonas sp.]MCZ8267040.1 bifunctional aspartate kinase/homoserine dehydrogenase I [Gemmatimonas sp.]
MPARPAPPSRSSRVASSGRRKAVDVFKFGGASLADAAAVRHAIDLILTPRPSPVVTVVSALAGVTDALLAMAESARTGDFRAADAAVDRLEARHVAVAEGIIPTRRARAALVKELEEAFAELRTLAHGVASLRELTPRTRDFLVARGEQLSARLVVAGMQARRAKAQYVEAAELIVTDGVFGNAFPDLAATDRRVRDRLAPLLRRRLMPVVPGFVGASPDGALVTLGRGGSDLTATVLGRALKAQRITLWKDVPGLMTTDPRLVPSARIVPQLNVREAAELAYYGAKVLHPRALIPLARIQVPVFVRPFAEPDAPGTEISTRHTLQRYPVKALSIVRGQALVTVTGNGMLGVPGIAARTFAALQQAGISVTLITQASSEHSISLCVPAERGAQARTALEDAFALEVARRELEGVEVQGGMATLAVVGLGMAGSPGIASRMFSSLSGARVNIVAIAQGSSELNISVVITEKDAEQAARAVHDEFQLDKIGGGGVRHDDRLDVVLLGVGQIGRELLRILPRTRRRVKPTIVGLIDRSGYLFNADGLSARQLLNAVTLKEQGASLMAIPGATKATAPEAVSQIARHALSRPVLVDLTADQTLPAIRKAITAEWDVVLANKKPLSASRVEVEALRALATQHGARILHETTVGAGLPVMDSYAKLVETGDKVLRIEGCTSGTLGFLLTEIGKGRPFSEALRDAMARGYTEPDPRDDLSGMDVARKALILARLIGFAGDLSDVTVESLVPEAFRAMPVARFKATLADQDAAWAARQAAATRQGRVLRYVLRATRTRVQVGLQAVPPSHPLAGLRGTDNQIVFTTMRYREHPLVITGPGAGPAVTAAGVLNDILQLTPA